MSNNELIIQQIVKKRQGKQIEIEIQLVEDLSRIYFQTDNIGLSPNLHSALAVVLYPAMLRGSTIVAKGNVSRKFYSNLNTIMEIFSTWDPSLSKVNIEGITPVEEKKMANNRVGSFFSGGADSFYTLLENKSEITDLIYFHEVDRWKGNEVSLKQKSEKIRQIGREMGKRVVILDTNVRAFAKKYKSRWWTGAALAAMGHLLSNQFHKVYISSGRTYNDLSPGSYHPLLDPLWGNEQLQFVHFGADKTRLEKVASLANSPIALENLQVCTKYIWENCCECEKCVRTMINLNLAGALERSAAFPKDLDLMRFGRTVFLDGPGRRAARENIAGIKKFGGDKVMLYVLKMAVAKSFWVERFKNALRRYPSVYQFLKKANIRISNVVGNRQ